MAIDGPLQNKTILVTGASSGLGRSFANECAKKGNQVFAAARSINKLKSLQNEEGSGRIIAVETDIRDSGSVQRLFEMIDQSSKRIDLVINNASIGHNNRIQEIDLEEAHQIVLTNLLGTIMITREAIRRMLNYGNGHIAFVSSLAGKLAFPNLSVYSATKFGIEGFAEAAREELKGTGIDVTVIRPGIMDTNFFETAGMTEFARDMKDKMQNPDKVALQALKAVEQNEADITIGNDKRFMPFLKHLPLAIARKLLPYIT